MNRDQIALQLYTVRQLTAQDMPGTLRALAGQGYRAVELAGYGSASHAELRATLAELGMRAISAHVALDALAGDADKVLAELAALGCAYAVVPFVAESGRRSADDVRRLAAQLNRLGERAQAAGLQLAYHNHAFEFAPLDGGTMYDILTAETDAALVALELDAFWAEHAGLDPIALIRQYAGRLPLLHAKDRPAAGGRPDAPVGAGALPWPAIIDAADAAGVQWYIVEQDHPAEPLADVECSLAYLQSLAH